MTSLIYARPIVEYIANSVGIDPKHVLKITLDVSNIKNHTALYVEINGREQTGITLKVRGLQGAPAGTVAVKEVSL